MATLQEILAKAQKAGKTPQEIQAAAQQAGVDLGAAGASSAFQGSQSQQAGADTPQSLGMPTPTVATAQQPVVDRSGGAGFQMPDFSDIEAMDQTGLQDYLDSIDVRISQGEQIDTPELIRARRAARMLQMPQEGAVNPYEQSIAELQAEQERMRGQLSQTSEQLLSDRERLLEQQYNRAAAELERSGRRQQQAVQNNLSFSGFGRSTFAADQANEIQRGVSQAMESLQNAKRAELAAYQAELQGADAETLAGYRNQIREFQIAAQQWENQAIEQTNAMNQQYAVSFEEKINNLLQAASTTAKSFEELSDDEKNLISSYATVLLDDEGNVDKNVLEQIPAGLSAYVIQEAARIKGGLGTGEPAATVTIGTGKNQRRMQRNPETGRYDIPVGGGMGGGLGGSVIRRPDGVSETYSPNYNPNMISTYTQFIETGKRPTEKQIASLGGYEAFASDAYNAYVENENKKLAAAQFSLVDPGFYATLTTDERKILKEDMRTLRSVTAKIDDLYSDISKNGLPGPTEFRRKKQLKQKVSDLQLQLKEKGIYNLGVLNGPDLDIIEGVIPSIGTEERALGKNNYLTILANAKDMFANQVNANISGQGLVFKPGGLAAVGGGTNQTTEAPQSQTGTGSVVNTSEDQAAIDFMKSIGLDVE